MNLEESSRLTRREVTDRSNRYIPDVYALRKMGVDYCVTDGSNHYRIDGIEPLEFAIANGRVEDFAVTNVHKYIERFTKTRNPEDLKKVVDYAHILCGIELDNLSYTGEGV